MTTYKTDWGRVGAVWMVLIAAFLTIVSFQMVGCGVATAEELPIPVQTILGECAGCTDEGMIAVGNVIRNRAKYRNQTVEAVCLAPKQFSCWNDRAWLVGHLKRNRGVIDRAWSAWQASATEDVTGGADLYHANYVSPKWDWSKIEPTVIVGMHLFYREHK